MHSKCPLSQITEPFEECAAHTHSSIPYGSNYTQESSSHTVLIYPPKVCDLRGQIVTTFRTKMLKVKAAAAAADVEAEDAAAESSPAALLRTEEAGLAAAQAVQAVAAEEALKELQAMRYTRDAVTTTSKNASLCVPYPRAALLCDRRCENSTQSHCMRISRVIASRTPLRGPTQRRGSMSNSLGVTHRRHRATRSQPPGCLGSPLAAPIPICRHLLLVFESSLLTFTAPRVTYELGSSLRRASAK